jgi:hypothetical protein
MALATDPTIVETPDEASRSGKLTEPEKAAILRELNDILVSPPFRNSSRSKQFLSYVVRHKLEGRCDLLKERTIGTEIFQRKAGYATGDDPVVRVQAGEVRRRLEQYYHTPASSSGIRIDLPIGSYAPEFHCNSAPRTVVELASVDASKKKPGVLWMVGALVLTLALGVAIAANRSTTKPSQSALDQFWAPVLSASQPVLICLAKPVSYRPSLTLYQRYAKNHPGAFQTEVQRSNDPLPLDPREKMVWGDMVPFPDYGVAMGDVYAATRLSALFASINKTSQVRIGQNYSFEDLRNSPAVVIGAFNNRWTLQMTSNLHFAFAEQNGQFRIQEQGFPGKVRSWAIGPNGEIDEDFAIVTRLLDSKTGQVLIAVAGLGANGTQAAGELISRPDYLEEAFRKAPADWQKKNLQILLKTTVTDSVAGPPRVVTSYYW